MLIFVGVLSKQGCSFYIRHGPSVLVQAGQATLLPGCPGEPASWLAIQWSVVAGEGPYSAETFGAV